MALILSHSINQRIQQRDELLLLAFGMWHIQERRQRRPHLLHALNLHRGHSITPSIFLHHMPHESACPPDRHWETHYAILRAFPHSMPSQT